MVYNVHFFSVTNYQLYIKIINTNKFNLLVIYFEHLIKHILLFNYRKIFLTQTH